MRQSMIRLAMVSVFLACAVFVGCEESPDTENASTYFDDSTVDVADDRPPAISARMQISPASSTLATDGVAGLFAVEGASGAVNWSVQDSSRGRILTQGSLSATYRRLAAGDNVVIATDSGGNAAFAVVLQPVSADPVVTPTTIQVTPSSANLTANGETALFTVTGAIGAVAWSVQDISKGSILTQSSLSATYQRSASGDNVVIATDSLGNAVFALISQP